MNLGRSFKISQLHCHLKVNLMAWNVLVFAISYLSNTWKCIPFSLGFFRNSHIGGDIRVYLLLGTLGQSYQNT